MRSLVRVQYRPVEHLPYVLAGRGFAASVLRYSPMNPGFSAHFAVYFRAWHRLLRWLLRCPFPSLVRWILRCPFRPLGSPIPEPVGSASRRWWASCLSTGARPEPDVFRKAPFHGCYGSSQTTWARASGQPRLIAAVMILAYNLPLPQVLVTVGGDGLRFGSLDRRGRRSGDRRWHHHRIATTDFAHRGLINAPRDVHRINSSSPDGASVRVTTCCGNHSRSDTPLF